MDELIKLDPFRAALILNRLFENVYYTSLLLVPSGEPETEQLRTEISEDFDFHIRIREELKDGVTRHFCAMIRYHRRRLQTEGDCTLSSVLRRIDLEILLDALQPFAQVRTVESDKVLWS